MTGEHDVDGLVAFARWAEAAGLDSVWTGDSPLARTRTDPWFLLAAVAATTTCASSRSPPATCSPDCGSSSLNDEVADQVAGYVADR
jgi:hypothetical protein